MKKIRLTKYSFNQDSEYLTLNEDFDLVENHPNGFNVGTIREGTVSEDPKVGECYWVTTSKHFSGMFKTSSVVKLLPNGFKTLNSYYRLEVLEENVDEDAPEKLEDALANLFGVPKKEE